MAIETHLVREAKRKNSLQGFTAGKTQKTAPEWNSILMYNVHIHRTLLLEIGNKLSASTRGL